MHPPWSCDGGPRGGGIAGDAVALYTAAEATLVTRLRQASRQAYRIYSEEKFLAAEDWQAEAVTGVGVEPASEFEPEFALLGQAGPRREPKRWGRLAVLAALTSVVAAVVGVVALNATRSKPQSSRRTAARGGSSPEIVADRASIRPLDARPRKSTRRASVLVRRVTEHDSRLVGRPPITAHPHRHPQPTPPAETASAPVTAATPATPTTAAPNTAAAPATPSTAAPTTAASTAVTTATPTTANASTPVAATTATATTPAGGADAEFGFEWR
jgi:hypothetical protein